MEEKCGWPVNWTAAVRFIGHSCGLAMTRTVSLEVVENNKKKAE